VNKNVFCNNYSSILFEINNELANKIIELAPLEKQLKKYETRRFIINEINRVYSFCISTKQY
jgi:hypothetical protein